jgi:hypothetical protein
MSLIIMLTPKLIDDKARATDRVEVSERQRHDNRF